MHFYDTRLEYYRHINLLAHPTVRKCAYSLFMSVSEKGKLKLYLCILRKTASMGMANGAVIARLLNIGTRQQWVNRTCYYSLCSPIFTERTADSSVSGFSRKYLLVTMSVVFYRTNYWLQLFTICTDQAADCSFSRFARTKLPISAFHYLHGPSCRLQLFPICTDQATVCKTVNFLLPNHWLR